jgi:hypothetical protein
VAGRIRSIKPEILSDERTAGLSDPAWRLFVSMIVLADDYGNLRAQDRLLLREVWWARPDLDGVDIRAAFGELEASGLIRFYRVRGQSYAAILGWKKHQLVDRPGKPHVPGPDEADPASPVAPKGVPHTRRATDSTKDTHPVGRIRDRSGSGSGSGPGPGPSISAAPEGRATPAAGPEALLTFPTIRGKRSGDTAWRFTETEASVLREGYPDLDVLAEARKAWVWIQARADRRKTAGGMMPFLVGWLGRTQNRGGARTGTAPAAPPSAPRALKGPPPDLCAFHREVTDVASSDPYGWCALCRKFGTRPRRTGTSEPEPIGVGTVPGGGR